ncbi:fructosamine 3 kinase [Geosmithia morbida]|uniref:protein-ribulosamine 3-kinase n=1 Tax=Geosmithia morbida TaxID=1094350 RepID=A0A9P4YU55_9HYPO|nr:fructosamine 3 kinase [Geosmithia morbida]KAF4122865.1 fructosamine 3 kinase [Geosmithia morbida]
MVLGEFMAMSEIYRHNPSFVPQPLARGTYDSLDGVHFLLCEFRDMDSSKLPDLERFPALVADMHRTITSRDGRFGFGCTTYHGNVPIEHGWSDSWEEYFIRTTRVLIDMEQEARGRNAEILDLAGPLFEEVVPRLLRPLETGSKPIRPSLIHGDLWNGNTATDKKTSEPIIFDAAGFYAHNEYELAVWRQPWNEIGAPYRARYCRHFPPAEPADEFDDRGELYSVRVNLLDSILYKDDENYRHT